MIGRYTDSGNVHLKYQGQTCAQVALDFLKSDFPQWEFDAEWMPPRRCAGSEPVLSEPADHRRLPPGDAGAAQRRLARVDRSASTTTRCRAAA